MTAALLHDHEIPARSSDDFLQKAASSTGLQSELSENKPNKPSRLIKTLTAGAVASVALTGAGAGAATIMNAPSAETTSTQEMPTDPLATIMYPEDAVIGSQEVKQDGPGAYEIGLNIIKESGRDVGSIDNPKQTLTSSESLGVINPGETVVVVQTDTNGNGQPDYTVTTADRIVHDISDDGIPTVQTH